MAVKPENYNADELTVLKRKTRVGDVRRNKNGTWRITVDVEIELTLPDGRLVKGCQLVEIDGRGEPKRHPYPHWLKGKKR